MITEKEKLRREKISKNNARYWLGKKREDVADAKNSRWKGESVGYNGLHKWIERKLGKPKYCAYCQITTAKKFEWANISRTYKRDLSDWIRLCTSCHRLYDYGKIELSKNPAR